MTEFSTERRRLLDAMIAVLAGANRGDREVTQDERAHVLLILLGIMVSFVRSPTQRAQVVTVVELGRLVDLCEDYAYAERALRLWDLETFTYLDNLSRTPKRPPRRWK